MSLLGTPLKEHWLLPIYLIQNFDAECQITAQSSSCPFEWQGVLRDSHAVSLQFILTIGITHYHRIFFQTWKFTTSLTTLQARFVFCHKHLQDFLSPWDFFQDQQKAFFCWLDHNMGSILRGIFARIIGNFFPGCQMLA